MKNIDHILQAKQKIAESSDLSWNERVHLIFKLFQLVLEESTEEENIAFTTLFSRLSFLSNKHKFRQNLSFLTHTFRRTLEREETEKFDIQQIYKLGMWCIDQLIDQIWHGGTNYIEADQDIQNVFNKKRPKTTSFQKLIEAIVVRYDLVTNTLDIVDEAEADVEKIVLFDIPDKNELFTQNIKAATRLYPTPFHINLIDVEIDEEGKLTPTAFIINPDYLIDVTSVAAYTKQKGTDSWLYAMAKFSQFQVSKPLLIGNVVNYLLDALIRKPNATLPELYHHIFRLYPLSWAVYNNQDVDDILSEIANHYQNLKRVISEDLERYNIEKKKIYLEPSFYCRNYGLQGRLDMFHVNDRGTQAEIVELKSGKVFKPNAYKINNSHYTQTLCYDLMIQSAYGNKLKPNNYILYSKVEKDNLRYAPSLKNQQYEAMRVRNDLTNIDHALATSEEVVTSLLNFLKLDNYPDLAGYIHQNLSQFQGVYESLDEAEQAYFKRYVRFVAREQILAKTGEHGLNKSNGLSALWLENVEEKQDRFSIFNYLQLIDNKADGEDALLVFKKTEYSAALANFRIGDIAVLYPHQFNSKAILQHQVFKCTIIEISDNQVVVRLRNQQHNQQIFIENEYWNVEEDTLDSGYRNMFRLLFEFCSADQSTRRLILGRERPRWIEQDTQIQLDEKLTVEQKGIVRKVMNTQDYFLLWGPPGTGKTSMMLKNLAVILNEETEENIMILAYTNRAVDEICSALNEAHLQDEYIRIGSRYSVKEEYRDTLLNHKIKNFKKRDEIIKLVDKTRIYTGTLSSIISANELFMLKKFHTVIIDEASQILEPMLAGLLTRFDRFVLIGDHKQLPAIVKQDHHQSLIEEEPLIELGFTDARQSMFERLYFQAKANQWDNSWALLSMQGRMHKQIMKFVSTNFYEGKLKVIPTLGRLTRSIHMDTNYPECQPLAGNRMIYIDTPPDREYNMKTNEHESRVVELVIDRIIKLYEENKSPISPNTIGVITPYRAQIALIKQTIGEKTNFVTVDTVERYQGGARNIIIISLCTNRLSQLRSLVSLSAEGIDRKLNVALTRAKDQIIILGNRAILAENKTYQALIEHCHEMIIS